MVRSTMIFRVPDGLPLAASVDDNGSEQQLAEPKQQSKLISRRLTEKSEPACSIETGNFMIHYLLVDQVAYLTICDKSYPRKLAFSYLDELSKEFQRSYESQIASANRPYSFRGFDTFISKTTRLYEDTRTAQTAALAHGAEGAPGGSNLDKMNAELQDVTRIMTKNMEDLLWRGDSLDRMSTLSTSLRSESAKYRKAARNINLQAMLRKWAPVGGIAFFMIVFIYWRFF
ncbi:SNAP receptor [Naganishia albida]|nr:SNAP receptor [Naganishia albida]